MENPDKFDMDLEELLNEQERRTGKSARSGIAQLKRHRGTLMAAAAFIAALILLIVCIKMSLSSDNKQQEQTLANVSGADTSSAEEQPEPLPSDGRFTGLYMIDQGSGLYTYNTDGSINMGYPVSTVYGLYTGRKNEAIAETTEIDYQGTKAVVYSENLIKIESAKVLPLGAISQHTAWGGGESGCGAACLAMVLGEDYETLLNVGESFADQGSLNGSSGGMTFSGMQALCKAHSGRELVNAYSPGEAPSDTVKRLIDSGSYAIVLVRMTNDYISEFGLVSHFIVINGYIEQDGELDFIYANSYLYDYGGIPLGHIDSDVIDRAVNADFDEPRTIAYVEGV